MGGNWEWASNSALPMYNSANSVDAPVFGSVNCASASFDVVSNNNVPAEGSHNFRCVR